MCDPSCRSVLFPTCRTVMVHKPCISHQPQRCDINVSEVQGLLLLAEECRARTENDPEATVRRKAIVCTSLVAMATYLLLTTASSLNTETQVCLMWKKQERQTSRQTEGERQRRGTHFNSFSLHCISPNSQNAQYLIF